MNMSDQQQNVLASLAIIIELVILCIPLFLALNWVWSNWLKGDQWFVEKPKEPANKEEDDASGLLPPVKKPP